MLKFAELASRDVAFGSVSQSRYLTWAGSNHGFHGEAVRNHNTDCLVLRVVILSPRNPKLSGSRGMHDTKCNPHETNSANTVKEKRRVAKRHRANLHTSVHSCAAESATAACDRAGESKPKTKRYVSRILGRTRSNEICAPHKHAGAARAQRHIEG